MANLSSEQFAQLLATMKSSAIEAATEAVSVATASKAPEVPAQRNDPSVLGPMRQCLLGDDKMRRLTLFEEWLEEAECRMEYIGDISDKEKTILLRTWGGQEIKELIKRQASKLSGASLLIMKDDGDEIPSLEGDPPDSNTMTGQGQYQDIINGIRGLLMKNVNRTMAMYQLMNTSQGTMNWNSFIRELEIKARILNFDKKPYTIEEAIKDAAIFGMNDGQMKEKALAEDPSIETLTRWCQARESGKEDAHQLKGNNQVKKVKTAKDETDVNKMKAAGRFSGRYNRNKTECDRCKTEHIPQRCPSNDKPCFSCGGKNHFAGSDACPNTKKDQNTDKPNATDADESKKKSTASNSTKRIVTLKRLSEKHQKWVEISINGINRNLFTDTGSEYTIIPPEIYDIKMGPLKKPDINLRAWGCTDNLKIKGMVEVELGNMKGARTSSKVYVVEGHEAEPLLGDKDAEELGFITFNKEGRAPTPEECTVNRLEPSIPQKLRSNLQVTVDTKPKVETADRVTTDYKEEIEELVEKYKGSVFDDTKIGCMKIPPIHLDYDNDFKPKQPSFRNIPFFY